MGKMATQPLPPWGSPPPQSGGQNQKWPTSGQGGYTTNPCRIGDPHRLRAGGKIRSGPQVCKMATQPLPPWGYPTLERGAKSEGAHKWAEWLHNPWPLGDRHRLRAGGQIRSGPQMGKMATQPLPSGGSPPPQSNRGSWHNQNWPTSGQGGYISPTASGIPTTSERGAKSEVAHLWAR